MTDQLMFDTWVGLLRPLFPTGAEFTFKSRRRLICAGLPQADKPGRANQGPRAVNIAFTQLAWKTYRGGRCARRAQAGVL
jgi:hypothetical protein